MKSLSILFLLVGAGCTTLTYQEGTTKFTRTSFGSATQIGKLIVHKQADGIAVEMQSYSSDQVQAIGAAAEGAARGAAAAIKP